MVPGEWFYRDLQLALSGLALIMPGAMLLTRVSPGSPALFAVANFGGWFLGTIALVQLPTGGSDRALLTATFFVCGALYGVLGFLGMSQNRNNDVPNGDDIMERIGKGGFGHYFCESKRKRQAVAWIWGGVAAVATGVIFKEMSRDESNWLFWAVIVYVLVRAAVLKHRKAKLFPRWEHED